jgi:hypothetical protein
LRLEIIDVRTAAGYGTAPGSRTSAGIYTGLNPAPPAPLPDWITGLLQDKINTDSAERPAPSPQAPSPAYAQAALADEHDAVATAAQGTRNDTLNRSAFSLGQLVADGTLAEDQVTATLTDAALTAGLDKREIAATIRSGLTAGRRFPRSCRLAPPPPEPPARDGHAPVPRR